MSDGVPMVYRCQHDADARVCPEPSCAARREPPGQSDDAALGVVVARLGALRESLETEVVRLRRCCDAMTALLRSVEWSEAHGLPACPSCGRPRDEGHESRCRLAAIMVEVCR